MLYISRCVRLGCYIDFLEFIFLGVVVFYSFLHSFLVSTVESSIVSRSTVNTFVFYTLNVL